MGNACFKGDDKTKSGEVDKPVPEKSNGKSHVQQDHVQTTGKGDRQALRLLGKGSAADTWLFRDTSLSKPVAIKLFSRPIDSYPIEAVQREVLTQTDLGPGHINLINVYELFLTPDCLGLVMECGHGGSLTAYVSSKWEGASKGGLILQEDEALYLFKQFIGAVSYCHRHNLAHRDLKLDNTLLDDSKPPVLKICDFGFARHFSSPLEKTKSHLGTPEYMSPELLHKTDTGENDYYDARSSDVWATGIMLLVCLCGAFPFDHGDQRGKEEENDLWMQEVSHNWQESRFIAHNVGALSSGVKDLLDKILVVDPAQRIDIQGITKHPWFNKPLPAHYQQAIDRLTKQQAELERHVAKQNYDQTKVAERSAAINKMIEDAGTISGSRNGRKKSAVKALKMFSHESDQLQTINLTEGVILSGSAAPHRTSYGGPEDPVVRERFNRSSVSQAVIGAFSGDSQTNGLSEAAKISNKSRHGPRS